MGPNRRGTRRVVGALSGADLRRRLESGDLVVTPLLDPEKQCNPGSASLDLRLGSVFKATRRGKVTHVDSNKLQTQFSMLQERFYVPIGDHFVLHPNHFVLAETLEYLRLPDDLGAYVVTRSSWGRHGLVIATAIGIHPGYFGVITLELRNLAEIPIMLYPGRTILQVFFHTMASPADPSFRDRSAWRGSVEAEAAVPFEEQEVEIIDRFKDFTP